MDGGKEPVKNINLARSNEEKPQSKVSEKTVFEWNAKSFERNEKTTKWYLAVALFITVIIAYSAWQRDWFVIGITIVVSAVLFWYIHSVTPQEASYKLTPIGIYVDDRFYPFDDIHSFWMVYNQNVKNLYIAFTKKYLPTLIVSLENIDPVILKGYLLKKIPEQEKRGESLVDKFTRIAGL
jgi:hypothetical protein